METESWRSFVAEKVLWTCGLLVVLLCCDHLGEKTWFGSCFSHVAEGRLLLPLKSRDVRLQRIGGVFRL
jgi:hypothetical protein